MIKIPKYWLREIKYEAQMRHFFGAITETIIFITAHISKVET